MRPHAFSMVEILIVLAILVVLAALLFPFAQGAIDRGNQAKCISNLRQISVASTSYSSDNSGRWPPNSVGSCYALFLIPYLGNVPGTNDSDFMRSPLICPSSRTPEPDGPYRYRGIYTPTAYDPARGKFGLSYGQNVYAPGSAASTAVPNRAAVQNASQMMLYMDIDGNSQANLGRVRDPSLNKHLLTRHDGNVNVAYADGSVRTLRITQIPTNAVPARMFWSGRGQP